MAYIYVDPAAAGDADFIVVEGECYRRIGESDQPPDWDEVVECDSCEQCDSCYMDCPPPLDQQPALVAIDWTALAAACHWDTPPGCPLWDVPVCGSPVVLTKSSSTPYQWVASCCVENIAFYFYQIGLATYTLPGTSTTCCYWNLYVIMGNGDTELGHWCGYKVGGATPTGTYTFGWADPYNVCEGNPSDCGAGVSTLYVGVP